MAAFVDIRVLSANKELLYEKLQLGKPISSAYFDGRRYCAGMRADKISSFFFSALALWFFSLNKEK